MADNNSDTGDGVVQVAYLHSEHPSHSWVESMRAMLEYDLEHGRIARKPLNLRCGAGLVAQTRNYGARLFLDKLPHEWLAWIDTDMGFEADAVHRLLEVADPATRPVVGALCFAFMESAYDGMGGWRRTIVPTMYKLGKTQETGDASFCYYGDYESDTVTQVAATGGAFLLIHRSVLEKLRAEHGDHWFDQIYDRAGDIVGEDLAFCGRLLKAGIIPAVHTGVKTTHHKEIWLSEQDYMIQRAVTIEVNSDLPVHIHPAASLATFTSGGNEQNIDGLRMWKLPADLDRYAAVIAATRPDVVVETGSKWGGSARWFEQQGVDVVTVDIDPDPSRQARALCQRTTWITGSSTDPQVVAQVAAAVAGRRVMVSLDSEHAAPHVAAEIAAYGPLVSPGCYLVVEDGIFDLARNYEEQSLGGHMIPHVGGPLRAIEQTLVGQPGWERDEDIERMNPVSHHPAGFWRRHG